MQNIRKFFVVYYCFILLFTNVFPQSEDYFPCEIRDYSKLTHTKMFPIQTGGECFQIRLPYHCYDYWGSLSVLLKSIKYTEKKYLDIDVDACSVQCDASFLSHSNDFLKSKGSKKNSPATFGVYATTVRIVNEKEIYIFNQETACTGNYTFTQNKVNLQLDRYKLDFHKKKNLPEIIYLYEHCSSGNPARHRALAGKLKIRKFIGVFASEATISIPTWNSTISIPASEVLIGNYFFSALLSLEATPIDANTYLISFSPNKKEQLTTKQLQKRYFDKLNMKLGNFYYDSLNQQLLFDVYYVQKK